jgi:starvation-inducible DNA-binding protein
MVKMKAEQRFKTGLDMHEQKAGKSIEMLNQFLADTIDLYNDTKQAHWNVKGENFYMLHLLFDKIADEVEDFVDDIAERITAIGGYAYGTTRKCAEKSRIPEYPLEVTTGKEHLSALTERYAQYANHVRKAISESAGNDDPDTADLFTEISRSVEKSLWLLEAHNQG